MKYLGINGRQAELAIAELEALYGPANIKPLNQAATLVDCEVDFKRLGSTVKITRVLEKIHATSVEQALSAALPHILEDRTHRQGKLQLGVSVYGKRLSPNQVSRAALGLKKKLRAKNFSVRLIPNKHQELNAAQVLRNKLTKENGFELTLVFNQDEVYLCKTLEVQDIDAYTKRDRHKPVRDPLVGMLPPKLAQTLINLSNPKQSALVLDPFCGTGTVLLEALEMGFNVFGSDISPDMVAATRKNLEWFRYDSSVQIAPVELADACSYEWPASIDAVACETFLGPALRSLPDDAELQTIIHDVDDIHRRFLQNIAAQLKKGTRLTVAVPAWFKDNQPMYLPVLDDLEKLGYTRLRFEHINQELVYHRPQQVVGRHILGLIRK